MLLCVHLELLLKFSPPASSHTFWVNAHQIHSTYIVNYFVDALIIVRNLVCSNMVLHSVVRDLLFTFLKIILSFLLSFLLPSPLPYFLPSFLLHVPLLLYLNNSGKM